MNARRATSRLSLSLAALAACTLPSAAHALPLPTGSTVTSDVIARALTLIDGHPGASKVVLLAERPEPGSALDVVHVAPTVSRASMSLALSTTPDCTLLEASIARVNASIDQLASLASALLSQLELVVRLQDELTRFELEHAAELLLAAQATAELTSVQTYLADLELELRYTSDPDLVAIYQAEIAVARQEEARIAAHPPYVAVWEVARQARSMQADIEHSMDTWQANHDATLASAERSLSAAQAEYETYNAMEVGRATAAFPLWDPDVLDLIALNGARQRVQFQEASLENLSWRFDDAALPRSVPIEVTFRQPGALAKKLQTAALTQALPLPGLEPLPSRGALRFVEDADFAALAPERVVTPEGLREVVSWTVESPAPQLEAVLSLGAYCGSLHTYDVLVKQTNEATLRAQHHEFVRRPRAPVEAYQAVASYQVRVEVPVYTGCSDIAIRRCIIDELREPPPEIGIPIRDRLRPEVEQRVTRVPVDASDLLLPSRPYRPVEPLFPLDPEVPIDIIPPIRPIRPIPVVKPPRALWHRGSLVSTIEIAIEGRRARP